MSLQNILISSIYSGIACGGVSFYLNANKKDIPWGVFLGILSWLIYLLVSQMTGSAALGFFLGSLAVSIISEILAFTLHNPATVYLLPALLPLVPGAGIFLMMRSAVMESMDAALLRFYEVMLAAGSIALGVAISSSIFKVIHSVRRRNREKRNAELKKSSIIEKERFESAMKEQQSRVNSESPEEDGSF